jgi:hypothetical protein
MARDSAAGASPVGPGAPPRSRIRPQLNETQAGARLGVTQPSDPPDEDGEGHGPGGSRGCRQFGPIFGNPAPRVTLLHAVGKQEMHPFWFRLRTGRVGHAGPVNLTHQFRDLSC